MGNIVVCGWVLVQDFFAPMGCKMFFWGSTPDPSYLILFVWGNFPFNSADFSCKVEKDQLILWIKDIFESIEVKRLVLISLKLRSSHL